MMKKLKLQSNSSALQYIQILKITVLMILYLLVFQSYLICFLKALKNTTMLLTCIAVFHMFSLSAQTPRKDSGADGLIRSLEIGSTLPEEAIAQIKTQHNKGGKQLYILDFWTTWCGACLASFPHLNALQSKFSADIQIILLNGKETKESANARLQKIAKNNPILKLPDLSQIYDARLFESLFPHLSVPHHIWLDRDFKVIAITRGENTNEKNISHYLKSRQISLPTKFELMDFDLDKSLLAEGEGRQQNLLIGYSLFLDSIYGAPSLFKLSKEKVPSLRIVNRTLLDLSKIAFGMNDNQWASNPFRSSANIVLHGKSLNKIAEDDIWTALCRKYCYENKAVHNESVYTILQQDLKRFFGIEGTVQTIATDGWKLETGNTHRTLKYKKGRIFSSLNQLQFYLNENYAAKMGPFDYIGKGDTAIDVTIPSPVLNSNELVDLLQRQGILCKPARVTKQILQLTYNN